MSPRAPWMSGDYQETVPSNLSELNGAWDRLEGWLSSEGSWLAASDRIHTLRLAFVEGLVNAITHAHGEDGRDVTITCLQRDDHVEVRILDTGPGHTWPAPSVDGWDLFSESGRGVMLMQQLMDEASYEAVDDGNLLTLRLNLEGGEA